MAILLKYNGWIDHFFSFLAAVHLFVGWTHVFACLFAACIAASGLKQIDWRFLRGCKYSLEGIFSYPMHAWDFDYGEIVRSSFLILVIDCTSFNPETQE